MARRTNDFQTIRSEGGLLPPDLLRRVLDPKANLEGTRPEDYGLPRGERLNEVITQSWSRLCRHWAEFCSTSSNLPKDDPATGVTNERWSLPLLRELGFGPLPTSAGPEIDGRTYAINRFVGPVPVHLIGCGLSLDRRAPGVRGAAAANPHGLVQEFLNRSPGHLWAIASNGHSLRILRDSQALSRQSFIEFDLEAMFDGEVYSDFVLLWLVTHSTRFSPLDDGRPESCWLEQWTKLSQEQGTRALGDLRIGVERALQSLGEGFTGHPKNAKLRESLRSGEVSLGDFHGQLLRVVYRLIFLFVAEDRKIDGQSLLHPFDDSEDAHLARERYAEHYSTARLRELGSKIRGSRHGDLWQQFQLIVGALSALDGFAAVREKFALAPLGSFLWDPQSTAALNELELTNYDFLEAVRYLAFTRQGKMLRIVDYKNLGAEELGGVYESLLALTPQITADGARFTFAEFAGSERKMSGSYYTHDSLVQCLLDSALDPVVEESIQGKSGGEAEKTILALKVCDPAVGSGHFLIGAAHRLARHLARVRALAQGESEPSPRLYQHALRDVIGRCLYGVDVNPMAAELCRVGLWLETLEPGKPLSFLDHHIRVGNSLLGTTPGLMAEGLPDETFQPIEGDDKKACAVLKKRNRGARKGLGPLFAQQDADTQARLEQAAATLEELPDDRAQEIRVKEQAFRKHEKTEEYKKKKLLAHGWCAAFVTKKHFRESGREASVSGITQSHLNDLVEGRTLPADLSAEAESLSEEYNFFHWHLVFPEVFAKGGFDCVLGNPPWERVKLQEKEWFAERSPEIANAPNAAARKRMIDALKVNDSTLYHHFRRDIRKAEGESHFTRNSGRFPLCGRGDINLYTVFAEFMRNLLNERGRVGCVLPTGIVTDDTTKFFFQDIVKKNSLVSVFDFENRAGFFPDVDSRMKFCLLTCSSIRGSTAPASVFVFFAHDLADLRDPDRNYTLSWKDIQLLNPNTSTCPVFRTRADAEICLKVYRTTPIFRREIAEEVVSPWDCDLERGFRQGEDEQTLKRLGFERTRLLITDEEVQGSDDFLPLVEGKTFDIYDHRAASIVLSKTAVFRPRQPVGIPPELHQDPTFTSTPYYWVEADVAKAKFPWAWFVVHKKVTSATNERTMVATILGSCAVNDTVHVITPSLQTPTKLLPLLCANLCSFPLDYLGRQKVGGNAYSMFIAKQLPLLPPQTYSFSRGWTGHGETLQEWLLPRVLELVYTAWGLEAFAGDCGWLGPPFRWDEKRRFLLRCELDAAFFDVYLPVEKSGDWRPAEAEIAKDLAGLKASFPTPRDAAAYIMDTFPIVRRKDEKKFDGDFRTKRVILEIYDAMQESILTGKPYQTRLDPPPADPRCCHPPK